MNERIPKIKKKQIQSTGTLEKVDVKNRDVQDLLREINKTCLDTDFHQEWEPLEVFLVHNSLLEASFIKKRSELKDEGRSPQSLLEQIGFLAVLPFQKSPIACNGLHVSKQKYCRLGKGECGVYINRFFDTELKSQWNNSAKSPKEIFVFKYFYGKRKAIAVNQLSITESSLEPTPNYDCHISSVQPTVADSSFRQTALSSIYLYEYTEACEPSICPRQCLPYAVIKCAKRCVPPKPLKTIPGPTAKDLQAAVSKEYLVKEMAQNSSAISHRVPENPARNVTSVFNTNLTPIPNSLNELLISTKMNSLETSVQPVVPVLNQAKMNKTDSVKRSDTRPALKVSKDFLQNQSQYLERLVAANTIVQDSKSTKTIDNIGSILPVFAMNSSVSSLHSEDSVSRPNATQSVKSSMNTSNVRDPRLQLKKPISGSPEKRDDESMESHSNKKLVSAPDHQPKKTSKRLSLFEYLQKKDSSPKSTQVKQTNVMKNNLQLHTNAVYDSGAESDIDLLPTNSPEARMRLSQNTKIASNACSNLKVQTPVTSQHTSSSSNLFQSFNSCSQHTSSSSNLFQSFNSCPVSSTTPSNTTPSTRPKPKPKVQKLLPMPVCNEDGPVINIYRGIVNGTFQEINSLSSTLQSSMTTKSVTKHSKNLEGKDPVVLTENLDCAKENISSEKTEPVASLIPKAKDAHKLKKVIHNVLERQLSNNKKWENDLKGNPVNDEVLTDQLIQSKKENANVGILTRGPEDVSTALNTAITSADKIPTHSLESVKDKSSVKDDSSKIKDDIHKKQIPTEKIGVDSKQLKRAKSLTENKTSTNVIEKVDKMKRLESTKNVKHKQDKKHVAQKEKSDRKHIPHDSCAERRKRMKSDSFKKRNDTSVADTKEKRSKQTPSIKQTNTADSVMKATDNKTSGSKHDSAERKVKSKTISNKKQLPADDNLRVVPELVMKTVPIPDIVKHCDVEHSPEIEDDHDSSMEVMEDNLIIPNDDNHHVYLGFVCRSPNADIPSVNLNTLNFSSNAVSSKPYCGPLRLIPSLCDDLTDPTKASQDLLHKPTMASPESIVKESLVEEEVMDNSAEKRKKETSAPSESSVSESPMGTKVNVTSIESTKNKGMVRHKLTFLEDASEKQENGKAAILKTEVKNTSLASAVLLSKSIVNRTDDSAESNVIGDPRGEPDKINASSSSCESPIGTPVKVTSLPTTVVSNELKKDKVLQEEYSSDFKNAPEIRHDEGTACSTFLEKEWSIGSRVNEKTFSPSSAICSTKSNKITDKKTGQDDSALHGGATEKLQDVELLEKRSPFRSLGKKTSFSVPVISLQSNDKFSEKENKEDLAAKSFIKNDSHSLALVQKSSANPLSTESESTNVDSCQEHILESDLEDKVINRNEPSSNDEIKTDGFSLNNREDNDVVKLKSVSFQLISNSDCSDDSSVGHLGAEKYDTGSDLCKLSNDDDEEDTLPKSISMQDLGISCYLQVLSEIKYQPSILLVDYKKAFHENDWNSGCDICKKELADDDVLAKHMNCKSREEEEDECGRCCESESVIGDNCVKSDNELVRIQHQVMETNNFSVEFTSANSSLSETLAGIPVLKVNSEKGKYQNAGRNSELVVAELGEESSHKGKGICNHPGLLTQRLTKVLTCNDNGHGKEIIPIGNTSPQETDYSISSTPVLIISENSPNLQLDQQEIEEFQSEEAKDCHRDNDDKCCEEEDSGHKCEEDPLKDSKTCDSADHAKELKLKLIRERLSDKGIFKPAKWKVSAPPERNETELKETKTNSEDYDDLRDLLLDDMLSLSSSKTCITSQTISQNVSNESGIILKDGGERRLKVELKDPFVENSFPCDVSATKTHFPTREEKSKCSDMLEILESGLNVEGSSLMLDKQNEISCSENSKFFGMIPRSAQKFIAKKNNNESKPNHDFPNETDSQLKLYKPQITTHGEKTILSQMQATKENNCEDKHEIINNNPPSKTGDSGINASKDAEKSEKKWKPINSSGEGFSCVDSSESQNDGHSKSVHFTLAPRNKSDTHHYQVTKIIAIKDQSNLVQHTSEKSVVKLRWGSPALLPNTLDRYSDRNNVGKLATKEYDDQRTHDLVSFSEDPTAENDSLINEIEVTSLEGDHGIDSVKREETKQAFDSCRNADNFQASSNKVELRSSKEKAIDSNSSTLSCKNMEKSLMPSNKDSHVTSRILPKPEEEYLKKEMIDDDNKPFVGINSSPHIIKNVFSNQPLGDVDYRIGFGPSRHDPITLHGYSVSNQSDLKKPFQGKMDDYGDVDYRCLKANHFPFHGQFGIESNVKTCPSPGPDLSSSGTEKTSSICEGSGSIPGESFHQRDFRDTVIAHSESSDKKNNLPFLDSFDETCHPVVAKDRNESGKHGKDNDCMDTGISNLSLSGPSNKTNKEQTENKMSFSQPNSSPTLLNGQWLNPLAFFSQGQSNANNVRDVIKSHENISEMIDSGQILQNSSCVDSAFKGNGSQKDVGNVNQSSSPVVEYQCIDSFKGYDNQTPQAVEHSVANINSDTKQDACFNRNEYRNFADVDSSIITAKALLETEKALGDLNKDMPNHSAAAYRFDNNNYTTSGDYQTTSNFCDISFMQTYSTSASFCQNNLSQEKLPMDDNIGKERKEVLVTSLCEQQSSEDKDDAESHSALDNIRRLSSKLFLQKIQQEIANTYYSDEEEGSDCEEDAASDDKVFASSKVPCGVNECDTPHTEKINLTNDHLSMLQKAINTVKALSSMPRTNVVEKPENLTIPVNPVTESNSNSNNSPDCHFVTSAAANEGAVVYERCDTKHLPALSDDSVDKGKHLDNDSKSGHMEGGLRDTLAEKIGNVTGLEDTKKNLLSGIASALVTSNKQVLNTKAHSDISTQITQYDRGEEKNEIQHSEISTSSQCSENLLSDHSIQNSDFSSTAEHKEVPQNDVESCGSDSKEIYNSTGKEIDDIESSKEIILPENSNESKRENKVLLSEVPMEYLAVARLHILSKLVTLKDDNAENDNSDSNVKEEDKEDGEICDDEASVTGKESVYSISETDELPAQSDSDHERSVVIDESRRKFYRDLDKTKREVVVVSSDSDSGNVSKVSDGGIVNTRKWKVIRDKPIQSDRLSLTRKQRQQDYMEVISSGSDSSLKSNVESPRVVKFDALKIHLDNSRSNPNIKERSMEKRHRVVTVGASPSMSISEEKYRDMEKWRNAPSPSIDSTDIAKSGNRREKAQSENGSERFGAERVQSGHDERTRSGKNGERLQFVSSCESQRSRDSAERLWSQNTTDRSTDRIHSRKNTNSMRSGSSDSSFESSEIEEKGKRLVLKRYKDVSRSPALLHKKTASFYRDLSPVSTSSESSSIGHSFDTSERESELLDYVQRELSPDSKRKLLEKLASYVRYNDNPQKSNYNKHGYYVDKHGSRDYPVHKSKSPPAHCRSRSPPAHHRTKSPPAHHRTKSPPAHHRTKSPPTHRSKSPLAHHRCRIPQAHHRSRSPPAHRSKSPPAHCTQNPPAHRSKISPAHRTKSSQYYDTKSEQSNKSRSPSYSGSGDYSSSCTTSHEGSFSPKKKCRLQNKYNMYRTRKMDDKSDLVDYFSSPSPKCNDSRNRYNSPPQRNIGSARSYSKESSYNREREHPLDELTKPLSLLKRKAFDSNKELDYYISKNKRHCESRVYPSFRK